MSDCLVGRRSILRCVNDHDIPYLARLYRDLDERELWTSRNSMPTDSTFREQFYHDLQGYYHTAFVICVKDKPDIPVGFFYTYQYSPSDGTLFTTIVLDRSNRLNGVAAEAGMLAYRYLFNNFPLRKIYADIFDFNQSSLAFARQCGFVEEGYLKHHTFRAGAYRGLYTFALYRKECKETVELYLGKEEHV